MTFIKPRAIGPRFDKCHAIILRCITDLYHAKPTGVSVAETLMDKLSQL